MGKSMASEQVVSFKEGFGTSSPEGVQVTFLKDRCHLCFFFKHGSLLMGNKWFLVLSRVLKYSHFIFLIILL